MIDLTTIDARRQLCGKWATVHGLDTTLVCCVCDHESSFNPWAFRPEPGFEKKYIDPMHLTNLAEVWGRTCSWGLLQLMGETARELGFQGRFLTELCDPDTGVDFGCRKLKQCVTATTTTEAALLRYNGGGDPAYPSLVLQFMPKYTVDPTPPISTNAGSGVGGNS